MFVIAQHSNFWRALIIWALATTVPQVVLGQEPEWYLQQELLGSDVNPPGDGFAYAVDLDGDTAVVGAPYDDVNRTNFEPGSVFCFERTGTVWSQAQQLFASDGEDRDGFGISLALEGNRLVVGTDDGGAAYVFERSSSISPWTEQYKFSTPDGASKYYFGASVALSGDTILVGEFGYSDNGTAHVFVYNGATWENQTKLVPSDGLEGDRFGLSMDLDQDRAVIGAPKLGSTGAAYVFERSGGSWDAGTKLLPSDSSAESFGGGVAVQGDTVVVGTDDLRGDSYVFGWQDGSGWLETKILEQTSLGRGSVDIDGDTVATEDKMFAVVDGTWIERDVPHHFTGSIAVSGDTVVSGHGYDSALVFVLASNAPTRAPTSSPAPTPSPALVEWVQVQRLLGEDVGAKDGYFGYSLDIKDDVMVVGARYANVDGLDDAGAAFVYHLADNGTWSFSQKLIASDKEEEDWLGDSVALSGDWLVVGAVSEDPNTTSSAGSIYVFRNTNDTWVEFKKIFASDAEAGDQFGDAVAMDGETLVVGGSRVGEQGAAYAYVLESEDWVLQQKLVASDPYQEDAFGAAVAISGDTIVVGAPMEDENGDTAGSAYIFERSGSSWDSGTKITATIGVAGAEFGNVVSINNDLIVIGEEIDLSIPNFAHVYRRDVSTGIWSAEERFSGISHALDIDADRIVSYKQVYAWDGRGWVGEGGLDKGYLSVGISGDIIAAGERGDDYVDIYMARDVTKAPTATPTQAPSKPPTPRPTHTLCFSSSNTVDILDKGTIQIKDLRIGDFVRTSQSFSRVYSLAHNDPASMAKYLQIQAGESRIEISEDHMLFVNGRTRAAKDVQVGDYLSHAQQVTGIKMIERRGLFAPLTENGEITVSGVPASSYVSLLDIHPELQVYVYHAILSPLRVLCRLGDACKQEDYSEGYSIRILSFLKLAYAVAGVPPPLQIAIVLAGSPFLVGLSLLEQLVLNPIAMVLNVLILTTWIWRRHKKAHKMK